MAEPPFAAPQDHPAPSRPRRFRGRWAALSLLGLAGAGLLAAVAGFGFPASWQARLPGAASQSSDFAFSLAGLAAHRAGQAEPEVLEQTVRVGRGDTLLDILIEGGVARADAHGAVTALRALYDPRNLKQGQELTLRFGPEPVGLTEMIVPVNFLQDVTIRRAPNGAFLADTIAKPVTRQHAFAAGVIDSSLYQSGLDRDVPATVLAQMFQLYSYDVDFQREIQPRDRFEILYDQYVNGAGELVHAGQIRYALLELSGKPIRIYHYVPSDGKADFFDGRGESVRKALLRTPIDGARLSSGFGMRQHPILGYTAMHRGVDFAAPTGTPIQAAGNGTIEVIGPNGGYGNYIRVRHTNAYATAYAHLSIFAKGLRKGNRVSQGQVIGFVGSTGNSTGPHLHYEVLSGGTQINPLSIKVAASRRLEGKEFERYRAHLREIDAILRAVPAAERFVAR